MPVRLTPIWTAIIAIALVLAATLLQVSGDAVPVSLWTLVVAALVAHFALQASSSALANGLVVLAVIAAVVILLGTKNAVPTELWTIAVGAVSGTLALAGPTSPVVAQVVSIDKSPATSTTSSTPAAEIAPSQVIAVDPRLAPTNAHAIGG